MDSIKYEIPQTEGNPPPPLTRQLYLPRTPKIKFCPECNNVLYARQSREKKVLVFICRACLYQREANPHQNCVYVNKITHEVNEISRIPNEVIQDPTLARTKAHKCPKCGGKDAVFMQGSLRGSEIDMKLYYVCTDPKCIFKWTE